MTELGELKLFFLQFGGEDILELEQRVWIENHPMPTRARVNPFASATSAASKPVDFEALPRIDKDGDILVREKPADAGTPGKYAWGGDMWEITKVYPVRGSAIYNAAAVIGWNGWTKDGRKFPLYPEDRKAIKMAGYDTAWMDGVGPATVSIFVIDAYEVAKVAEGKVMVVCKAKAPAHNDYGAA